MLISYCLSPFCSRCVAKASACVFLCVEYGLMTTILPFGYIMCTTCNTQGGYSNMKMVKWCKIITTTILSSVLDGLLFVPTFRPMGGPSSGNISIQDCYDKVHDCVLLFTGLFTVVAMVTLSVVSMDTAGYILNCVYLTGY